MAIIVPFYAAILALFYIRLTFKTIGFRQANKVSIGSGGHEDLDKAIRAHGNFIEFPPIALLLVFFIETKVIGYTGLAGWFWTAALHLWCLALLAGRVMHSIGMTVEGKMAFRKNGMIATILVIISSAITLLILTIWQLF